METGAQSSNSASLMPSTRPDLAFGRSRSDSSDQAIKLEASMIEPEASHESNPGVLDTPPDPKDLDSDSDSELSSVPSDLDEDEHGLSPVPSTLSSPDLIIPVFDSDSDDLPLDSTPLPASSSPSSKQEGDDFVLDPVLFITHPAIGSIISLRLESPLCDCDDLLRLASQQTVQEITDSVNQLKRGSITRGEVQAKIQEALERVAGSRDVTVKVVASELEEAKRVNGVVARERGRKRRSSGDEVVVGFSPAGQ